MEGQYQVLLMVSVLGIVLRQVRRLQWVRYVTMDFLGFHSVLGRRRSRWTFTVPLMDDPGSMGCIDSLIQYTVIVTLVFNNYNSKVIVETFRMLQVLFPTLSRLQKKV